MEHYSEIDPINAGAGIDLTIRELAEMIQRVTGFEGAVIFDHTKP